jgi:membrane protease YdiL (CAAX protease family)
VLIGVTVTGLALLESWRPWFWAPFPIAHAALAILIPVWFWGQRTEPGKPPPELMSYIRPVAEMAALALVVMASFIAVYAILLRLLGRSGDPAWNILSTYRVLAGLYFSRYGETPVLVGAYLLVGVWPMFGEELFYRAFLFGGLLDQLGLVAAAAISSMLFGLRHAFQLAYLLPAYPAAAGVAYFLWAAAFGLVWCCGYHRTRSLWPNVAVHSANLVLAPVAFALVKP